MDGLLLNSRLTEKFLDQTPILSNMELYQQEKVQSVALKSEIMQRDNQVEKLKAEIRQCQADTKLAKLETEALVK